MEWSWNARRYVNVGDIRVRVATVLEAAQDFADYCVSAERAASKRPVFATSVNGHVISLAQIDPEFRQFILSADVVDCDGQPMVVLSKLLCTQPLKERVATTDLFPALVKSAAERNISFYLLGGTEEANAKAVANIRKSEPALRIVGNRNGYFSREEEPEILSEIRSLRPDILWVSLGVPKEQEFCTRNLELLTGVGIVKTSGGLFDFLSGDKPRAPGWMQTLGFEWLFRLMLEPRRLFLRYLITSPHAFVVMVRGLR